MNITEKYFLELLRGFATEQPPQLNIKTPDMEQLSALSLKHNMRGIVGHMLRRYDIPLSDEIQKVFFTAADTTVMQMIGKETAAFALCDLLSKNGIPHILFKGITVSECYPVKELRTYGDIDIVVKESDSERIRTLLTEKGFSSNVTDGGTVTVYRRGKEHYEMHTALNVDRIKDDKYFCDMWENTVVSYGETRVFTHNFHLCYLIAHLEKHVYGGGAGAKLYLDIALYINKHRSEIDLDNVREVLVECGLGKFLDTVLYMCHMWYKLEIPQWVTPLEKDIYKQMCGFTMANGVFGDKSEEERIKNAFRTEMSIGKKGAKARLVLSRVFPPRYELVRLYPECEGKPALLPAAWFKHVGHVISSKRLGTMAQIASANAEEANRRNRFFESIGSDR